MAKSKHKIMYQVKPWVLIWLCMFAGLGVTVTCVVVHDTIIEPYVLEEWLFSTPE